MWDPAVIQKVVLLPLVKQISQHFISMDIRRFVLGSETVEELYEYQILGVLKSYVGSFSSNGLGNIEKFRKEIGLLNSANFDRRMVKPFIHIKFWKQGFSTIFAVWFWTFHGNPKFITRAGVLSDVVSKNNHS